MGNVYDAGLHAGLKSCFDSGRSRPLDWRLGQLRGLEAFLRDREAEIARAVRADFGKSPAETWLTETGWLLSEIRHVRRNLRGWLRPRSVPVPLHYHPARARVLRDPLGVVLVIGAWNYPLQLVLAPLVGAIAGGNCAVVKPSELAPHSSSLLAGELPGYLDADAFLVVEGDAAMGRKLLTHRFDHVFFTGSRDAGREVMHAAAVHLTPVTLELGGKCPCIVTDKADLKLAARRIVWAKFLNAGQTCVSPDYLLVHDSVEEELLELMREAIARFYGDEPMLSPDYPGIIDERQFRRLCGYVAEGDVAAGGKADAVTRRIEPTIVRIAGRDSRLMREEMFGPVLPVLRFPSLREALGIVRAESEPLAVYLFSRDPAELELLEARTVSGGVCCNDLIFQASVSGLPFGGRGMSGMGRYHGRAGFETFTAPRSVLARGGWPDPDLRYPPYGARKLRLLKRIVNLFA